LAWGCQPRPASSPTGQNSPSLAPAPTSVALSAETQALLASGLGAKVFSPPRQAVRLAVISDLNNAYGSTSYEPEVCKALQLLPF
jgi:hypothetical protein